MLLTLWFLLLFRGPKWFEQGRWFLSVLFDERNRINKNHCAVFFAWKNRHSKKHADGSWVLQEYTTIKFMAQDQNTPVTIHV